MFQTYNSLQSMSHISLYHIFNWIKVSRKGRYSIVSFHLLAVNRYDRVVICLTFPCHLPVSEHKYRLSISRRWSTVGGRGGHKGKSPPGSKTFSQIIHKQLIIWGQTPPAIMIISHYYLFIAFKVFTLNDVQVLLLFTPFSCISHQILTESPCAQYCVKYPRKLTGRGISI